MSSYCSYNYFLLLFLNNLELFGSSSELTAVCSGARRGDELFRVWLVLQGKAGLSEGLVEEEEVAITQGI